MIRERVVDPALVPWRRGQSHGVTFACQVLLDGADGGPEALRFRFDPCLSVYAHMHLTAQFQLLIGGGMDMPRGRMDLRALAVHYTDHNVPYGPFATTAGHDMLVLHPRQGGLVPMTGSAARAQVNLQGRLLTGPPDPEAGTSVGHEPPGRRDLMSGRLGPTAALVTLAAGGMADDPAPVHGRYDVVLEGHAMVGGVVIRPPGFRHVLGDERAAPLVAGPSGARIAVLSFDADALEGGVTAGGLGQDAARAMAAAL